MCRFVLEENILLTHSPATASRIWSGQAYIYDLRQTKTIELDEVASQIWEYTAPPGITFGQLIRRLQRDYAIEVETLSFDAQDFLYDAFESGIITLDGRHHPSIPLRPQPLSADYRERVVNQKKLGVAEKQMRMALNAEGIVTSMTMELTYRCNEKCIHCYIPDQDRNQQELSTERIKILLDELRDYGVLDITFTGGDPFLRHDFLDIVEYARKNEFAVNIFTNGLLATPDILDRLAELYLRSLQISIYSTRPEKHDSVTCVPGSWHRSIVTLKKAAERGIPINIKAPLMSWTVNEYRSLVDLAYQMGATIQIDAVISARNDGDTNPLKHRVLDRDMLHVLMRDDVVGLAVNELQLYAQDINIPNEIDDLTMCGAGIDTIVITPNGEVNLCTGLPLSIGNVCRNTLHEVLETSPQVREFQSIRWKDTECKGCQLIKYCLRCPGMALSEAGDIKAKVEHLCMIAGMRYEAAIEKGLTKASSPIWR